MFNKTNEKEQGHDEDDEENQDDPGPVLLPQTPRVKHDREERRKNTSMRNSLRRSSGRVLTGKRSLAMTNKRTSRKASRVAQQKISKNVEDLSNLGKKMRRPLNSADSTEEGDDETEEDVDADEQPSASKRMKSIGEIFFCSLKKFFSFILTYYFRRIQRCAIIRWDSIRCH